MKQKERAYSIALASAFIIFSIFVSSAASSPIGNDPHNFTVPEISSGAGDPSDEQVLLAEIPTEENSIATESIQPATLKITETQITTNESKQNYPVIYGNRIVWMDDRNGDWDIYMYDISTSRETQITTNEANQEYPVIYGDRIVWTDNRNGDWDIYMYDLSTSKETQITTNESNQNFPAIYGDRIVWIDERNGNPDRNSDIYMYDLSTSKETQITTNKLWQLDPDIYGDKIVWQDWRNVKWDTNWDIYMYDLSTSKETQITTNKSYQRDPAIYGNRIIWMDEYNIHMYNLSTSQETQITTSKSALLPATYGNRIVWEDYRSGNADIYMYNLSTSAETRITTNGSNQKYPDIYDNKIVWEDFRNGNTDIYMVTLSTSPVAAFSASPTSGKAPLKVKFTDNSTGSPTSWKWTFGDGTSSTKQNPTHKYSKARNYTVSLTVTNAEGSNTVTKKDYINVVTKPVASFSAKPTSGKVPLTVAFTDKSAGIPTKWKWSFGDGKTSTQQNPKHQYLQEGNYKVTLTVTNAAGSSTVTKTNYIKVTTNTRPGIYSESK
mgnify:CR=1 FL=1